MLVILFPGFDFDLGMGLTGICFGLLFIELFVVMILFVWGFGFGFSRLGVFVCV